MISGNGQNGVTIAGTTSTGNPILRNSYCSNDGLDNDLNGGDLTVNDDPTAAGYGWFVDATPNRDEEFVTSNFIGPRTRAQIAAATRMDLLTAVMHELTHTLGHGDLDPLTHADDLMSATLAPGVRRTTFAAAVDAVFAGSS